MTWALVPLIPKDDTRGAARSGGAGHGWARAAARRRRTTSRPGGRGVDVEGGGQDPVVQGHHHLDHPGDAGGGLGVADVGLHRAEPQRRPTGPGRRWPAAPPPRPGRRAACRCRGLDRVDVRRRQPGRRPAPGGSPAAGPGPLGAVSPRGPVLVDGRAPHHGPHPVAVPPRVRQPLEHQHADALRPAGAVGRRPRRPCTARRATRPPAGRTPGTTTASPSRRPPRRAPACTPPPAAPGRPGAAPPATTSTPCRPIPPGPPAPGRRPRARTPRRPGRR